MIDVHAHFAEEGYPEEEWEKIASQGISIILASDTLAHSRMHAAIAAEHDCRFTVGVHPSECAAWEQSFDKFRALAKDVRCVAVGEIGLDYHYPDPMKEAQRRAFCDQLRLADELGLPVQIHSRDACADTLAILGEYRSCLRRGFLMHCYSYGKENLDAFASLGGYFSFGGVVCFKNARRAVESAVACPDERLLTETDSPYLSPFRGEKNTPLNIPVILRRLAELRGTDAETLEQIIDKNAKTLFEKL